MFDYRRLEFYDQISFLKGGMALADVVTTVSPSYAREIRTPQFGEALDGFLRSDIRRLVGIVNGIDMSAFDPSTDRDLPAAFSANALDGKATCRDAVAKEMRISVAPEQPLFAVVARMAGQKGLDLAADIVPHLYHLNAKLIVLGAGEPELESRFAWLANMFSNHISVRIGFDIGLARRIYAGSDFFLMPSRFEPCGLGQLYAMRYGSIPVVHAVGGLRDTVNDTGDAALARGEGTGIAFSPATSAAMLLAMQRAVALYRAPSFAKLRRAAMSRDSSWETSAREYVALYRSLSTS
jgi:starch synthase